MTPPPPPPRRNTRPQAKPKKKRGNVWLTVLGVLLVMAPFVAGSFYLYTQHEQDRRDEAEAYAAIAAGCHDTSQLRDYLDRFPNGENAVRVRQRLRELQEMESDWKEAVADDTPDAFATFKNLHHDPYYDRLADRKIDSLDFVYADAENTPEAYTRYISQHPGGIYRSKAIRMRTELENARRNELMRGLNSLLGTDTTFIP